MRLKKFYRKHYKIILGLLLLATILEVILSLMFDKLPVELIDNLPWIIGGTIVSESLFIIGLSVMAYSVGHDIGFNPLKWRNHLKDVVHKVTSDRLFWVGFWINAVGALATGIVWLMAIFFGLPPSSWGTIWLPIVDIALTVGLRSTILELKREKAL